MCRVHCVGYMHVGYVCVGCICRVWGVCMWGGVHTCRVHKEDRDPQALTFRLGGSGSYRGAIQVIPG